MIRRFALAMGLVLTFASAAIADDIPTLGPARDPEPPDIAAMLEVFRTFDDLYASRQSEVAVPAHEWIAIANQLRGYTGGAMDLSRAARGEVFVRAALIKGECHLLASMELFAAQDRRFLEQYELGIRDLAWVIRAAEKIHRVDDELGFLPDYSFRDFPVFETTTAGYESIGTGFEGTMREVLVGGGSQSTSAAVNRRFTYRVEPYHGLSDYQRILGGDFTGMPRQISTFRTARELLETFCPWGAEVFLELRRLHLVEGLDFRILDPYWGRELSTTERLGEMVGTLGAELQYTMTSLLWDDVSPPHYEVQPPLSTVALDEATVPERIDRAMWKIVGAAPQAGSRTFTGVTGDLGGLGSRPVGWHWVGAPTFEAWYTSPNIFAWQATDSLWMAFTIVKVYFGGAGGVIADEVLGKFGSYLSQAYGEGPVNLPVVTTVILESYDKGPLMPSLIEEGKWLSSAAIARKTAAALFAQAESRMVKDLYEGIDMAGHSLGISYDGGDIPPILIRGDVLGFPDVPDEYPHTLEAVRYFLVYPQSTGNMEPFQKVDLSVPGAHVEMDSLGWWRVPDPFGSIDIINRFAPKEQVMEFRLAEAARDVQRSDQVTAELWTVTPGEEQLVVSTVIDGTSPFQFIIHNAGNSEAAGDYRRMSQRMRTAPDAPSILEAEAIHGRHHRLLIPKTRYTLKILVQREIMAEHPVILDRGRDGQREITGRLHSPGDGTVVLDFEPEIEIVKLEVAPPKVVGGSAGTSR